MHPPASQESMSGLMGLGHCFRFLFLVKFRSMLCRVSPDQTNETDIHRLSRCCTEIRRLLQHNIPASVRKHFCPYVFAPSDDQELSGKNLPASKTYHLLHVIVPYYNRSCSYLTTNSSVVSDQLIYFSYVSLSTGSSRTIITVMMAMSVFRSVKSFV
jgi:hypothetical protein